MPLVRQSLVVMKDMPGDHRGWRGPMCSVAWAVANGRDAGAVATIGLRPRSPLRRGPARGHGARERPGRSLLALARDEEDGEADRAKVWHAPQHRNGLRYSGERGCSAFVTAGE